MVIYKGIRTVSYLSKARKYKQIDQQFIERIMIAVTEVNGCDICSYAHTKMALEAGMSNEEIQNMLAGEISDVPQQQVQAIMFAQHYAESRGKPSKKSWDQIVNNYGESLALGILGSIRVIMMGNVLGIPYNSFFKRFKGQPDQRSSMVYELKVMTLGSLFIPIVMIHALFSALLKQEVVAIY
jgi:AhpD family alkylhydroperoxidase